MVDEVEKCAYEMFPKTYYAPAEYCENPVEFGAEYCTDHDPDWNEPDWDSYRKDWRYDD